MQNKTSYFSRRRRAKPEVVTQQYAESSSIVRDLTQYAVTSTMNKDKDPCLKSTQHQDDEKPAMDSFSLQAEKALEDMSDEKNTTVEPTYLTSQKTPSYSQRTIPQIVIEPEADDAIQTTTLIGDDEIPQNKVSGKSKGSSTLNTEKPPALSRSHPNVTEQSPTDDVSESARYRTSSGKTETVSAAETDKGAAGIMTHEPSIDRLPKSKTPAVVSNLKISERSLKTQREAKISRSKSPSVTEQTLGGNSTRKNASVQKSTTHRVTTKLAPKPRPKSTVPDITKGGRNKTVSTSAQNTEPATSYLKKSKTSVSHARSDPNIFASSTRKTSKLSTLSLHRPARKTNPPLPSASGSQRIPLRDNNKIQKTREMSPLTAAPSSSNAVREKQSTIRSKSFVNPNKVLQKHRVAQSTIRSKSFANPSKEEAEDMKTRRIARDQSSAQTDSVPVHTKRFLKSTASSRSKPINEAIVAGHPRRRTGSQNSSASSENASISSGKSGLAREARRTNLTNVKNDAVKRITSTRGIPRLWSAHAERSVTHKDRSELTRVRPVSRNSSTSSENMKTTPSKEKAKSVKTGTTSSLQPDKCKEDVVKHRPPSTTRKSTRPLSAHSESLMRGKSMTRHQGKLKNSNRPVSSQSFTDTTPRSQIRTTPSAVTNKLGNNTIHNKLNEAVSASKAARTPKVSQRSITWLKVGDKSRKLELGTRSSRDVTKSGNPEGLEHDDKKEIITSKQKKVPTPQTTEEGSKKLPSNSHAFTKTAVAPVTPGKVSANTKLVISTKSHDHKTNTSTTFRSEQPVPNMETQDQNTTGEDDSKHKRKTDSQFKKPASSNGKYPASNRAGLARSASVRPSASSSGTAVTRSYSVRVSSANAARNRTESSTSRVIAEDVPDVPAGQSVPSSSKPRREIRAISSSMKSKKKESQPNSGGRSTPLTRTVLLRLQKLKKDSG